MPGNINGNTHDTDDTSLVCRVGDCSIWFTNPGLGDIVRSGIHTTHNTLVVSFENDGD